MDDQIAKHRLLDNDDDIVKRPRYECNHSNIITYSHICHDMKDVKDELDLNGIAIYANAISNDLCDASINQIWTAMESLIPVNRNDSSSFELIQRQLCPNHGGLFQWYHLGHLTSIWDIRLTCLPLFQHLWGVSDLVCSMDGLYFKPPSRLGIYKKKNWYHVDQGSNRIGLQNWQGAVNLTSNLDDDAACLSVFFKSHLYHTEYLSLNHCSKDFVVVDEEYYLNKPGVIVADVRAPKGALVLWDSRTVHMGKQAMTSTAALRSVAYVSMMPRRCCSVKVQAKRLQYFHERRTLSHWCDVAAAFGKFPRYMPLNTSDALINRSWQDIPGVLKLEDEGSYMSLI